MAFNQYAPNEAHNIALGQKGSILVTGTSAITALGGVFVAIQILEDTVFASGAGGLSAETLQLYPDDTGVSSSVSASNGAAIDGVTFPQGMTIYGRWTDFTLASGKVVAYIG